VTRPDIDAFETAIRREKRDLGFFVAFDFTDGALREIDRFQRDEDKTIVPKRVADLVEQETKEKWYRAGIGG